LVDATGHALAGADALFAEPLNHVEAADAVMAKNDQSTLIGAGVQILKLAGDSAHFRQRELVRLADVDQMKLFAGVEPPFDFLGIDFERRGHHFMIWLLAGAHGSVLLNRERQ
jgi:hypothetical protein